MIWDEEAIAVVQRMQEREGEVVRGEYIRTASQSMIRMTEAADLTTLLHESAHLYLSTLARMVNEGIQDEKLQSEVETILRYLEVDSVNQLTLPYADGRQWDGRIDIPHERFARSFEAYLAEGRAPNEGMRKAFRAFRSWMVAIYGSLKEIAARLGVTLNDEIRGVFDRMVAADDVMQEAAEPVFASREEAAMSAEQWEAYLESFEEIRDEASRRVVAPLVRRVTAQRKRERRELFDSLYDVYAEQVDAEPIQRAIRLLRDAEPGIAPFEGRLNYDQILALYARPETAARVLASVPRGTVARGGELDLQTTAEFFGFKTGSAFLDALVKAPSREEEIRRRVNEEIARRPEFQEETIERDARGLLGGEDLAKRIAIELTALRALAKEKVLPAARRAVAEVGAPEASASQAILIRAREELQAASQGGNPEAIARAQSDLVIAEAAATAEREGRAAQSAARRRLAEIESTLQQQVIRERAAAIVANRPAGGLAADRRVWAKELQKAQAAARKAIAGRDYLGATRSMERAALLNWSVVEADAALAEQPKILNHARSFDRTSVRDRLRTGGGSKELELIDIVLDKYDLRRDVPVDPSLRGDDRVREIARRRQAALDARLQREAQWKNAYPSFAAWAAQKQADLEVVDVDESLFVRPDRRHWKELTVAELQGLGASLRNMEKLARNEVAAAKGALAKRFTEAADDAVAAMVLKNASRTARDREEDETWRGLARRGFDTVDALHIKMSRLFRWMAGDESNPLLEIEASWGRATDREAVWLNEMFDGYGKLVEKLYRNGKDYRTKIDVPGLEGSKTRGQVIAFALNLGTDSNLKKLQKGYKLSDSQVESVVEILDDTEWNFVQEVWDLVNSLWSEMSENHYRLTGVRVEKVQPRVFVAPTGKVMRGGYYPIAYDPNKSSVIDRIKDRQFIESMFDAYASAPTTSHGFTEKRKDEFAAPILLDLDVVQSHIAAVIHDVVWRETLRDSWKIFHQPQLKAAIVEMYGKEYFDAIEHRIRMLAGATPAPSLNLRWLQWLIQRTMGAQTAYALAGAYSTTFAQFTSLTNAIPRVADGNIAEGSGLILKSLYRLTFRFRETRDFIFRTSTRMRYRASQMDASIREQNEALEGRTDWVAKTRRFGFSFIATADYFISGATWLARYEKVMSETMNKDKAIAEANIAVERTQGAGNVKDLAQIQDTDPLFRPLVMFYSYFSALYSELHSIGEDAAGGKLKKAAAAYLLIVVIPGMLADLVKLNFPDSDDDDPEKEWAKWVAYHMFFSPFSSVVVVRDVASYALNAAAGKAFGGYDLTPATGAIDQLGRTISTLGGAAFDEDDDLNPYEVLSELTATTGQLVGLPFARQLNIIASNLARAEEDGVEFGLSDLLVRRRKE